MSVQEVSAATVQADTSEEVGVIPSCVPSNTIIADACGIGSDGGPNLGELAAEATESEAPAVPTDKDGALVHRHRQLCAFAVLRAHVDRAYKRVSIA